MNVLVTGASGFVGSAVVERLHHDGVAVRAASRSPVAQLAHGVRQVRVGDLTATTDWREALHGMDAIVHAAARVHVMHDTAADPLAEFRRVNVEGTVHLARAAADAGVRRLVFVSSIKVNGEGTEPGRPYRAGDCPAPVDAYGVSKREAEDELRLVASETGLEVVVVRPVLVYGPGVKGNFLSMMRWLHRGVPLPLGAIYNRRSLVALDNLVDLIATALRHPAAANETFLVSDGDDLSTTELLRRTATALGTSARLLPIPAPLLTSAARLAGRGGVAKRLCGSLEVDITATRERLGWTPRVSVDVALTRAARHFLDHDAR
jgi:nucleoside-diphosphate-sugar epimerase